MEIFVGAIFLVLVLAFIFVFIAALLKKRREVRKAIEEVVKEVQGEKSLVSALKNTKEGFIKKLSSFFLNTPKINEDDLEEIEAILFSADIGVKTVQKLIDNLKNKVKEEKNITSEVLLKILKEHMLNILKSAPNVTKENVILPKVIMFVGVNGVGKTTSIGKLSYKLKKEGQKVILGAGDTFRAAAVKQLSIWGEKTKSEVISGKENADSASVLFEAIKKGQEVSADAVLCDTAGRLHTKQDLMQELKKVYKVMSKAKEGAPDEVFLVIDATTGQNAIMQAKEFSEMTPLTGIIISKLDGTAKGGVLLGIVDELKVPIRYIGVGEKVEDLREFDADEFIDELFKK